MAADGYRFSFGPWNIHEGADPFGPTVRETVAFGRKLEVYKELGFAGVQFHDDDAVPDLNDLSHAQVVAAAQAVRKRLDDAGLVAEICAPRLWEDPRTIDGAYTSNDPAAREYALDRTRTCIDIANEIGTDRIVLWLAREGTYIREAKNARKAHEQLVDAINVMLAHDPKVRILIEPKPNEPMDQAYIPTIGHALALAGQTAEPARVGGLIETAHALLAGLDPSDEMAFALHQKKLWSVHLNDQSGLKFDEDKSFGAANLRQAFNQVRVLEEAGYASTGDFIGLDVKAMRTTRQDKDTAHLANSKRFFELMVEKVRTYDTKTAAALIADRDYEGLERLVIEHLLGVK
jgi:xylose isomerase